MMTFGGDDIDGNYGAYKRKLMMMMKFDGAMRNELALQRANLDLWSLSSASKSV